MKFILASGSPRRKELMKLILEDFTVITADIDERKLVFNGDPEKYVMTLAYEKAMAVAEKYPSDLVIGMDTAVYQNGDIFNKPTDREDAGKMFQIYSGNQHFVYTGFAIILKNRDILLRGSEKTLVKFMEMNDEEIENYLDQNDYMGKAGAYAVQGAAGKYVEYIEGDFYNVVGMPVNRIYRELKGIKVI